VGKNPATLPAILVLTGASGAGKSTLIDKLNDLAIAGVTGFNCDRVKVEVKEGSDRHVEVLRYWISYLTQPETDIELAVLDTQIRPHVAQAVLDQAAIPFTQIVLVDCDLEKRHERLRGDRGQPELVNHQMDCWAAYLRGQADALKLSIIFTAEDPIEKSLAELELLVKNLLIRSRAA
jgi:dephospho-CoA kinase